MQAFFLSFSSLVLNVPNNRAPHVELVTSCLIKTKEPMIQKSPNSKYMDLLLFWVPNKRWTVGETKSTALHRKRESQTNPYETAW